MGQVWVESIHIILIVQLTGPTHLPTLVDNTPKTTKFSLTNKSDELSIITPLSFPKSDPKLSSGLENYP